MDWRSAFLRQARADFTMFEQLLKGSPAADPDCHMLHYLQMCSEKLAKALQTQHASIQPATVHRAFSRFVQVESKAARFSHASPMANVRAYKASIAALKAVAERIEKLAPSAAGQYAPNPEYPWRQGADGDVIAPADFDFRHICNRKECIKLHRFLASILKAL